MEDKEIKSALEIAMEKAAYMPGLTEKELIEQKERGYKPRGAAIAQRYLEGALRERELLTELLRYQGEEGLIVRKAFLSTLCQSITLKDMKKSWRALDGIRTVTANANLEEIRTELEAISSEFGQQEEQRYAIHEDHQREKLHALGIFGSAVKPNLQESEDWRQELMRVQSEYDSRINELKKNLSKLLAI